jgi:hypothetical protein
MRSSPFFRDDAHLDDALGKSAETVGPIPHVEHVFAGPVTLNAQMLGVGLTVALGYLIGLVPLRPDFGSEIVSRTHPTVYDLLVALASGLAGAYAIVDERLSPTLPGVAIAIAIVAIAGRGGRNGGRLPGRVGPGVP